MFKWETNESVRFKITVSLPNLAKFQPVDQVIFACKVPTTTDLGLEKACPGIFNSSYDNDKGPDGGQVTSVIIIMKLCTWNNYGPIIAW